MPPSTPGTLPSTPLAPNNCCARMTAAEVRRWRYRERVAGAASRGRDAGAARLGPPPRGRCGWRRKVQGQGPGRRRPRGWRCPGRSWRCGGKRILVDLLKLNVAPLAVFQMLKSMCAGQRLASEPQDPAALSLPTSSVPETRGQSRACCPCPGGGGGRRGWGRRGTAASGVALCGQACLWGLDPAPAGPIRGLCSGALLLALAGMSRSGGHRVHAPGWSRRARAPPLSSLPTSSLRPSSHKVGNQDSLGLGTVVPAYNPSHNGRIVRSHEFETSLGDRVRSYL
ncbi:uncharacterized protein LOC100401380 isoform X1 [Callithrix jacchus]